MLLTLAAVAMTTALMTDPPPPPSYDPLVDRHFAAEITVLDADYITCWPPFEEVIDGVQVGGFNSVTWADDTGAIRILVDPETDYDIRATIQIITDDGDDLGHEPDVWPFHYNYEVPVTREHRIETAVRIIVEGLNRFSAEGGTFFELSFWLDFLRGGDDPQGDQVVP